MTRSDRPFCLQSWEQALARDPARRFPPERFPFGDPGFYDDLNAGLSPWEFQSEEYTPVRHCLIIPGGYRFMYRWTGRIRRIVDACPRGYAQELKSVFHMKGASSHGYNAPAYNLGGMGRVAAWGLGGPGRPIRGR